MKEEKGVFRIFKDLIKQNPELKQKLKGVRQYYIWSLVWHTLEEVVVVLMVYPTGYFFQAISSKNIGTQLYWYALWVYLIWTLKDIFHYKMDVSRNTFKIGLSRIVNVSVREAEIKQSAEYHFRELTGTNQSSLSVQLSRVETLLDSICFNAQPVLIQNTAIAIGLFFIHWTFGLNGLLILVAYATQVYLFEPRMKVMREEYNADCEILEQKTGEIGRMWKFIKVHGLEGKFISAYDKVWEWTNTREEIRHLHWMRFRTLQAMLLSASIGSVFVISTYHVIHTSKVMAAMVGTLMMYLSLVQKKVNGVTRLNDLFAHLYRGGPALSKIAKLCDQAPSVSVPVNPKFPEVFRGEIEFKNVSFSYETCEGEKAFLDSLSFKIPGGSTIALIGESGCGKTTIANLITRMYFPNSGDIYIDGVNIKDIDPVKYHACIRMVDQTPTLILGSIEKNISLCAESFTKEEVIEAARLSCSSEFIDELREKYETIVGADKQLSGGQTQRIAIARVFVGSPKIIILDEHTSALGASSLEIVNERLRVKANELLATTVVIAHRKETILSTDLALVMERGRAVAFGTHADLKANPAYCRIVGISASARANFV